jgi:hypothetical protein
MNTEIRDFSSNPQLRQKMINYYGIRYEMSATEDDLITEYHWLCRSSQLHLLNECEELCASWRGVVTIDVYSLI